MVAERGSEQLKAFIAAGTQQSAQTMKARLFVFSGQENVPVETRLARA